MEHRFAQRMLNLGTETAFVVGAEAAAWERKGHKVYPFHLGDMNLDTPENIKQAAKRAMFDKEKRKTGYCPPAGIKELREVLAEKTGEARDLELKPENISLQPAGKIVIGKFIQTLMNQGDEVLYPNPGYPIYESWINFLGGVARPYGFKETEKGFEIDLEPGEKEEYIRLAYSSIKINEIEEGLGRLKKFMEKNQ